VNGHGSGLPSRPHASGEAPGSLRCAVVGEREQLQDGRVDDPILGGERTALGKGWKPALADR
jgi:hypothetical protein